MSLEALWFFKAVCSFCIDCLINSIVSKRVTGSYEGRWNQTQETSQPIFKQVNHDTMSLVGLWELRYPPISDMSGSPRIATMPQRMNLVDEDGKRKGNFSSSSHQLFLLLIA